jgi:hypothetical protein
MRFTGLLLAILLTEGLWGWKSRPKDNLRHQFYSACVNGTLAEYCAGQ